MIFILLNTKFIYLFNKTIIIITFILNILYYTNY